MQFILMQMLEIWDLKNLLAYLRRGGGCETWRKKLHFLPSSRPLFFFFFPSSSLSFFFFFFLFPFPVFWAEHTSAPLKQVLGLVSWERIVSRAAVPASTGEAAVALTLANCGEELLQPSC